jgi:hypothetical protein
VTPEQLEPEALQVTPWLEESLLTVATRESVCPTVNPPFFGDTLTLMPDWAKVVTTANRKKASNGKTRFDKLRQRKGSEFLFSWVTVLKFMDGSMAQSLLDLMRKRVR